MFLFASGQICMWSGHCWLNNNGWGLLNVHLLPWWSRLVIDYTMTIVTHTHSHTYYEQPTVYLRIYSRIKRNNWIDPPRNVSNVSFDFSFYTAVVCSKTETIIIICPLAITCETLQPPQSGTVSVTGSTPGATARYSCNNGFLLAGLKDRVCQEDGTYTGQAPVCQSTYNY